MVDVLVEISGIDDFNKLRGYWDINLYMIFLKSTWFKYISTWSDTLLNLYCLLLCGTVWPKLCRILSQYLPFTTQSQLLTNLSRKPFENIVVEDQHFLLFPQCFLSLPKKISILQSQKFCYLKMLFICLYMTCALSSNNIRDWFKLTLKGV